MPHDRVASPSFDRDGKPVGAGGNPDFSVIGEEPEAKPEPVVEREEKTERAVKAAAPVEKAAK